MKRLLSTLPIFATVLLTTSCQKELPDNIKNIDVNKGEKTPTPTPEPTPTPTAELKVSEPGQFGAKGGEQTITVTATAAWSISKSAESDWLAVKPESGNAGTSQVTLTAAENLSTGLRTTTLTLKSGELTKSIDVSQSVANPDISIDASSLEFTSGSGSKMFRISSNTMWAISSDKNWCSVSPKSGNGDGSVTVSVEENTSTSERTATITVEGATITRTLAVTQNGSTPVTPPTSQGRTFTVGGVTFKMIAVEGGTFTMGATSEQGSDAADDEKPTHQVTLSSYYIGETEVTQKLWQAVMGSNPSYFSGSQKPVEYVNLYDCQDFISRLNSLTGQRFRLPTEAEWEFAARGGNESRGYKYSGSNTLNNVAWYGTNSEDQTHNVATKSPNELGLYDMSGNVLEWCDDAYFGAGSDITCRGGSWKNSARYCRVSSRDYHSEDVNNNDLGLRLAVSQVEDVNHDFQCFFLFDTQLHPMPCHLTSIINNPGQFCKIEAAHERGIRHLKTTRNYDGAEQDVLLSTERENQQDCILGAGNCIIVGTSNYDNILIAYEGQCSNCLELYGGTHYPLLWEKNGMQLHCNNCGRTYDVNNGTVVSGDGRRLYRYQAAFDGQFIRVWN